MPVQGRTWIVHILSNIPDTRILFAFSFTTILPQKLISDFLSIHLTRQVFRRPVLKEVHIHPLIFDDLYRYPIFRRFTTAPCLAFLFLFLDFNHRISYIRNKFYRVEFSSLGTNFWINSFNILIYFAINFLWKIFCLWIGYTLNLI